MLSNPNLITNLHTTADACYFDYHGWHARLQQQTDHSLRLTVSQTGNWPDTPELAADPVVTKHADETIATGGRGQRYEAPIITATTCQPLTVKDQSITINDTTIVIDTQGLLAIRRDDQLIASIALPQFTTDSWTMRIKAAPWGYYYGGGTQNGIVSLNGRLIQIKNENRWTQDGVSSPVPFYWGTVGYGVLVNSFTPGEYDFSNPHAGVLLKHEGQVCDVFLLLADKPSALIHAYHELTGQPNRNPRFSFYPAHMNAYNRDYWVPVTPDSTGAVQFEDGRWYKEYMPIDPQSFNTNYRPGQIQRNGQTLVPNVPGDGQVTFEQGAVLRETLNGEHDYQLSARAVIDRYAKAGFPLGWLLPNDGYGAGYGQTDSFAGDLANLRAFSEYASAHGVATGLWTQANLAPKDPAHPQKKERDFHQELTVANVQAIKTDVAWVGEGYTFGLNATTKAAAAMIAAKRRPMIVTVDGWAGTQRNAMVWTGDQAGSDWQNIATNIASYLSTGLSGNPNVASDIDGIYAGSDSVIQTRDLQWKAFTPAFFAMDGWGDRPKLMGLDAGAPYAAINRQYLQYHTTLLPYLYSLAALAQTTGAPIMRPTWWVDQSAYAFSNDLNDQLLIGSDLLVAPITTPYALKPNGDGKRAHVYLPQGTWYDFWSNQQLTGQQTLADIPAPLARMPLYVRAGALIPLAEPSLHPQAHPTSRAFDYYPGPRRDFTVIDDDGTTLAYQAGQEARTTISGQTTATTVTLHIAPTTGHYQQMPQTLATRLFIVLPAAPKQVAVQVNGQALAVQWTFGLRQGDVFADNRKQVGVSLNLPQLPIADSDIQITVTI
ncbi:TIM-barrel domain-containing protein [Lacticaseibacillus jixiensis]|uniref:TIM-barrel domain-containing protein n=1 Tax=Lacticaseibacillus jixiensis TaxID=3231926 RepID=UPI0036F396E4